MLHLFTLAVLIPFTASLATFRHLEDAIAAPAFGIRQTFVGTPPQQPSARAVLTILKRQNTCGAGFCSSGNTCCEDKGCCPGGAICCSNGSCCEAGTLCTQDSRGLIGCCPVGQTCAGSPAEGGEGSNGVASASSSTQINSSPTPSSNPSTTQSSLPALVTATAGSESGNNAAADTQSTNSGSSSEDKSDASHSSAKRDAGAAVIIGSVIAGIIGWLAICAGFLWLRKRRKRNNTAGSRQIGAPSPLLHDSRSLPSQQQGPAPEIVGLRFGIPSTMGITRPYTTLLERNAVNDKMERFADPATPAPLQI